MSLNISRRIARRITRREDPLLAGGTTPPAALDIKAFVGTSTSPTTTGTKAVTGVGFQPKAVLPFSNWHDAVGSVSQACLGFGAKTAGGQASIGASSSDGLSTSNTDRRHDNTKAATHQLSGTTWASLDITTLGSDGFTGSWVNNATARIFNHICLGGADLEVSLVQCQMNGTNAAQSFAHGLTGEPTGILFFSALNSNVPPSTIAESLMSIGAWAGGNQFGASISAKNGRTTTSTERLLTTNSVLHLLYGGLLRSLAVASVDTTNVNVTYPDNYVATQYYFFMLAIRGAKCQAGIFDCNGSTSPLTIATTGITPKLFLPVFLPLGHDAPGNVFAHLAMTLGACDGTSNVSCGITDWDSVTTTVARRYQSSNSLTEYWIDGTKYFESTAAFTGQSVVLTPSLNANPSFGQGGYFVIGR